MTCGCLCGCAAETDPVLMEKFYITGWRVFRDVCLRCWSELYDLSLLRWDALESLDAAATVPA